MSSDVLIMMKNNVNKLQTEDSSKLSKYYDPSKLREYLSRFEIYAEIMNEPTLDSDKRTIARKLFEHYRRMIINQVTKEISDNFRYPGVDNFKEVLSSLDKRLMS